MIGGKFDSLLAKLIVTGSDRVQALERARRALAEFQVEGMPTVLPFHRLVVDDPTFAALGYDRFTVHTRWIETERDNTVSAFDHDTAAGDAAVSAPMQGTVVRLVVRDGDPVRAGDLLVILEAMKMEHPLTAPRDGVVTGVAVAVGQAVVQAAVLLTIVDWVDGDRSLASTG